MQYKLKIQIFLFAIFFSAFALAQTNNAIQYYGKARDLMSVSNYKEALIYADMAISADSTLVAAYHLLAEIYLGYDEIETAISCYKKVFALDPKYDPFISRYLAQEAWKAGEYDEAKNYIDFFYTYCNPEKDDVADLERLKYSIYFSVEAVKNPVSFEPVSIGEGINTDDDEYWPSLSLDNKMLVFTRIISGSYSSRDFEKLNEDLFISYFNDSVWTKAVPLANGVNTPYNEGAQCISADGQTIIFTRCDSPEGMGDCDLYIQFRRNGTWTKPENLKSVNSYVWDSNPTLSSDGRTLYFSSTRHGGQGGKDLWQVRIDSAGNAISKPQNLGKKINTKQDDISPFIHPSNKILYFASNGHIGLGGQDLYMSEKDNSGNWTMPRNLGYPINTNNEERSLIVTGSGELAMFSSTRNSNKSLDVFWFPVDESFRPEAAYYLKGIIYDSVSGEKLCAKIELIDLKTGNTITEIRSGDIYGDYFICLPGGSDYALNVSADGYLFHSENFSLTEKNNSRSYILNIGMIPIETEQIIVLRNVFFGYNSYELLPESYPELNKVIAFINENPGIKIEIGGHTDNRGSEEYNVNLSKNRAKSVYDYLVENGIKSSQLSYQAYSYTQPITENDTEEGRAQNRRTELKIIKTK